MALADIADMTTSPGLRARISAAAARQQKADGWVGLNLMTLCATEGWDTAWVEARTDPERGNYATDTGCRTDVIADQMITDAVRARIDAEVESGSTTS